MMGGDLSYDHDGVESIFTLRLPRTSLDVGNAAPQAHPREWVSNEVA